MKRQLLGLLGAASVAVVQATTPCADSTVLDIISTNMTLGMALMANATAQIQASCNGTAISCSVDEADVVSILSDLYSGADYLVRAVMEYVSITGLSPSICIPEYICNCTQIPFLWNATESFYNTTYLPKWNEFALGTAGDCTAAAEELLAIANQIYCDSQRIAVNYETCRYECGLPCCDEAFALQFNTTLNAAVALISGASDANEASCASGPYSCSASNTYQTLQDLEAAAALITQNIKDLEELYGVKISMMRICDIVSPQCNCIRNQNYYDQFTKPIDSIVETFNEFSSGLSASCESDLSLIYFYAKFIQCNIQRLILNYNECLKECSCPPTAIQTGISESMTQALAYMGSVWTAYNAQCPGRFNCSSTNLTLVQEDLSQAIASYDLAIGNYTAFIQDTGFNTTCSLLNPSCSCRVLGDQLIIQNATYYIDYIPEWEAFIAGYTDDCTAQAELLRNLVFEQKCIAEQLNTDYGKCYDDCQTNWCLYYDCANKPCGTGAVWTPPPRSRWLRYAQLY